MPTILNDKIELKFNFTLAKRPMEIFTFVATGDFMHGTLLDVTRSADVLFKTVQIRKGPQLIAEKQSAPGNFIYDADAFEFWNDWVTDQEMTDAARNGDTD